MDEGWQGMPAQRKPGWVDSTLMPSITSGTIGGTVLGFCVGCLSAVPDSHHIVFGEVSLFALVGALIGLMNAWVGAAIVGLFHYLRGR
jgi:hypothetical protein